MGKTSLRSWPDRLRHTLLFEIIGLAIVVPLSSWLSGHDAARLGMLTVGISLIAMSWNAVFNALFDRVEIACGSHLSQRSWKIRIVHALLYEAGLTLITLPIIAAWLNLALWPAFVMDIGFVLFYLVYALLFNWTYDRVFPLE